MSECSKVKHLLEEALIRLERIEKKVDRILGPARAIMLPSHLRFTMIAVNELGEATTLQVAEKTGRSRGTESENLNQLVRMGYLEKWKVGRTAYFSPK